MGVDERFKQEQMKRAQADFARAVQQGMVAPIDRFGNRVRPGMRVLYRPPFDLVYEVDAITPLLDPRQPAGLVTLMLSVKAFPVVVPVGQIYPAILVLQPREEPPTSMTESDPAMAVPEGAAPSPPSDKEPPQ